MRALWHQYEELGGGQAPWGEWLTELIGACEKLHGVTKHPNETPRALLFRGWEACNRKQQHSEDRHVNGWNLKSKRISSKWRKKRSRRKNPPTPTKSLIGEGKSKAKAGCRRIGEGEGKGEAGCRSIGKGEGKGEAGCRSTGEREGKGEAGCRSIGEREGKGEAGCRSIGEGEGMGEAGCRSIGEGKGKGEAGCRSIGEEGKGKEAKARETESQEQKKKDLAEKREKFLQQRVEEAKRRRADGPGEPKDDVKLRESLQEADLKKKMETMEEAKKTAQEYKEMWMCGFGISNSCSSALMLISSNNCRVLGERKNLLCHSICSVQRVFLVSEVRAARCRPMDKLEPPRFALPGFR